MNLFGQYFEVSNHSIIWISSAVATQLIDRSLVQASIHTTYPYRNNKVVIHIDGITGGNTFGRHASRNSVKMHAALDIMRTSGNGTNARTFARNPNLAPMQQRSGRDLQSPLCPSQSVHQSVSYDGMHACMHAHKSAAERHEIIIQSNE